MPRIHQPGGSHSSNVPSATPKPAGESSGTASTNRDQPVTFTADEVEYDQETGVVRAKGNVEAWQGDRILRADTFTYNRNTGLAVAEGHVQLMDPDGQVAFADRAELTGNMRDGVVEGLGALLAQNGKLVASGARRTGGTLTDMARVSYTACDLCEKNPDAPPLWQLRSRTAVQDKENLRLRYYDATLDFAGLPILYTPYLSMPDPSAPRASGLLTPTFGHSNYFGFFAETPYYWAIDDQQDMTLTPIISTDQNPALKASYRRRFNAGEISAEGSIAALNGNDLNGAEGIAGHIYSRGRFSLDENWRVGFDLNRATSLSYLHAYNVNAPRVLPTIGYIEGFWGSSAYARLDARSYQGLSDQDDISVIPVVLPNLYTEVALPTDGWGGHATLDATGYGIYRDKGTSSRRLGTRLSYELPMQDNLGSLWTLRSQTDLIGHWADDLNLAPNYASGIGSASEVTANTRLALDWRMPFTRTVGNTTQLLEPRVQVVTGPAMGRQANIANEDSIDFEFTDANLFSLNRFPGRDRQEGGTRVDAAMRGAIYWPEGAKVEGIFGRSFRMANDQVFDQSTGLDGRSSDYVGRVTVSPVSWLDLNLRGRWDKETLDRQLIDTSANVSMGRVAVSAGYLYSTPNDYITPVRTRREVSGGVSAKVNDFWRLGAYGRYDIDLGRPVAAGGNLTYEDECFIIEARYSRRWAEEANTTYYPSSEILLFRVGFKTVGDFGLRAM
ncbi:LPS-assembly protein LptD [Acetobacteraceae bacterium H6797]|nr:LPS-assembly protein LptD [Acetobacteraceae bacterium H6797]